MIRHTISQQRRKSSVVASSSLSQQPRFARQLDGAAMVGMLCWLVALTSWWQRPQNVLLTVELLLLLAILVNVPLALRLLLPLTPASRWLLWALRVQPLVMVAAIGLLCGFFLVWPLLLMVPLALLWLLFTGLLALHALAQLPTWPALSVATRLPLVAMLFLPVGAAWLVAFVAGLQPLGFSGIIVLLTAVHFHFTGFSATVWVSMIGQNLAKGSREYGWAAALFVVTTPLIAAGITLSPLLEIVGVLLLVFSLVTLALLLYRGVLPTLANRLATGLLALSPLAMLVAITLAVLYGIGEFTGTPLLTIPQMVQWHGWLNGVGFTLVGLLGWRLQRTT